MCLAQGPQRSDAGETQTSDPSVKHSTTEPLRSLSLWISNVYCTLVVLSHALGCQMTLQS